MTTLAELGSALLPGARAVGSPIGSAPSANVTWVRVMRPRVPAFDGLEAGDVVIVAASALAVVAPGLDELRRLAAACQEARIAGFLLVERDVRTGDGPSGATSRSEANPFSELAVELADADLPALQVGQADVAALERAVIGFLVTGGAELERQAAALESRLERLALDGGGPTALVAAIASFLGRAVALEGRGGDALAVHAPAEIPDSAVAAARYQARPRSAVALRVPLPAAGANRPDLGSRDGRGNAGPGDAGPGAAGHGDADQGNAVRPHAARTPSAGGLVLLGDRPPSDLERAVVGRIAGLLALELSRGEAVRRAREAARRAEALPPAGPPWVMLVARQRLAGDADDAPDALNRREANRRELQLMVPARRMALRGDADSLEIRAVLAVDPAGGADPDGRAIAARIAAYLGRIVAVSRTFGAAADRPAAEAEARAALESAEALPGAGPVAHAARLPVYRILGALHHLGEGERLASALLDPLLSGRADVRHEHLATLRAVLDRGGVGEAAIALGVHRNTIAYRLQRIEAVSGWDLADPELRVALSIALRLVQDH